MKSLAAIFYSEKSAPLYVGAPSVSKKSLLPAKQAFVISFLPRVRVTASTLPGQKTLLSAQLYWQRLRLMPNAGSVHFATAKCVRHDYVMPVDSSVKKPQRGFFDGLSAPRSGGAPLFYQSSAITSTSTRAPLGRLRPPTQERAGLVVKYSP